MTNYRKEELEAQRRIQKKMGGGGISEEEFNRRLAAMAGFVRGPGGEWMLAPPMHVRVRPPMSSGTSAKTRARLEAWQKLYAHCE